jgi:agmatinase
MLRFLTIAPTVLCLTAGIAQAQYFGHEYEGTQAPIREGEQPVLPLDTEDPS